MDPNLQVAKLSCILYASEPNSIKGSGPSCSDLKERKRKFLFLSLCIFKQEQPGIKLFDIRKGKLHWLGFKKNCTIQFANLKVWTWLCVNVKQTFLIILSQSKITWDIKWYKCLSFLLRWRQKCSPEKTDSCFYCVEAQTTKNLLAQSILTLPQLSVENVSEKKQRKYQPPSHGCFRKFCSGR